MKRLFKYPYPKLTILIVIIIASYFIFKNPVAYNALESLGRGNVIIVSLLAGFLFSFGFTTPLSIALFIILPNENMPLVLIMGGIGSVISDLIIFKLIKVSFKDEIKKIEKTSTMKILEEDLATHLNKNLKTYLTYIVAGIIIASPLPDEIGVPLLSGFTNLKASIFTLLSFILHVIGIWIIIMI